METLLGPLQSSTPPDLSSFELPTSERFFKTLNKGVRLVCEIHTSCVTSGESPSHLFF